MISCPSRKKGLVNTDKLMEMRKRVFFREGHLLKDE
jgi:hypothetical protein